MTPRHVLVIDDIAANLVYARTVLEANGYTVVTASEGEAGLALAVTETPALILLDLHLPGMDGLAVVRRLRAEARTRAIPIVLMTAYADPALEREALAAGCQAYIAKPLALARFIAVVQRWAPRA